MLKAFEPCSRLHAHVRDAIYPSLAPDELAAAGHALFGAGWRRELARALRVSEAEIIRVERGRTAAPEAWRAELIALAQDMALRALKTASDLLWRLNDGVVKYDGASDCAPLAFHS